MSIVLGWADWLQHLASRKHRRFATFPENFADLDALLKLLRRQINPHFAHDDVPYAPCWDDHDKDYPCERCCMTISQEDSDHDHESGSESLTPATSSEGMDGIEEWQQDSPGPDTNDDTTPSSHDDTQDQGEEEEGEDGVTIFGEAEQEEEEEGDYFDESGEGKEFEE